MDNQSITYKFGPLAEIDIRFSSSFQLLSGCVYTDCSQYVKTLLQLICHAVKQLRQFSDGSIEVRLVEESKDWEYPTKEAVLLNQPVLVTRMFTCARQQILYGGNVVCSLREGMDCDCYIEYLDPQKIDFWIDHLLECALKHCKQYGRRDH